VLLRSHCHRGDIGQAASLVQRRLQRCPPGVGMHLGAFGVRTSPVTDQLAGFRIPEDDFARLR
jgi:hypothetical protein